MGGERKWCWTPRSIATTPLLWTVQFLCTCPNRLAPVCQQHHRCAPKIRFDDSTWDDATPAEDLSTTNSRYVKQQGKDKVQWYTPTRRKQGWIFFFPDAFYPGHAIAALFSTGKLLKMNRVSLCGKVANRDRELWDIEGLGLLLEIHPNW
jgi:hypothetical protein